MRDAARALDDVSDHLGEVLRRADDLLAEWSRFGTQVRGQVERDAAAIGEVVESAVGRVAAAGVDRAIADRLRALTGELERLEQRARAVARAAAEQRDRDRRLLWTVVVGIVLANALLVVLILRRPAAPQAPEAVRLGATSAPASAPEAAPPAAPEPAGTAGNGGDGTAAAGGSGAGSGSSDGTVAATAASPGAGTQAAAAPGKPGSSASGAQRGSASASEVGGGTAGRSAEGGRPAARTTEPGGRGADSGAGGRSAEGVRASPIALPPKPAAGRTHKKLP